jgi:hypothetical protein
MQHALSFERRSISTFFQSLRRVDKKRLTLYVKGENQHSFVKVYIANDGDIADLTAIVKAGLQIQEPATNIILRKADGAVLDSTMSVAQAGLFEKQKITVQVAMSKSNKYGGECKASLGGGV